MVDHLKLGRQGATEVARATAPGSGLLGRFATHLADSPVSFDVALPKGTVQHFGPGEPGFHVTLKNARAVRAITGLDEGPASCVAAARTRAAAIPADIVSP